jgi:hypothetical protein
MKESSTAVPLAQPLHTGALACHNLLPFKDLAKVLFNLADFIEPLV